MAANAQVYVIRHGQTPWSAVGRHTGLTDLDLTPAGEDQARSLRPALAGHPFVAVLVSPLLRARRTADLAGLEPTALEDGLVERDYGAYEGLTTAEVAGRLGRAWSVWTDPVPAGANPGESLEQLGARVDKVLEQVRALLGQGDVALVAHGHCLRALAARWIGLDAAAGALFRLETATYGVLGHEHDRPVLRAWSVRSDHPGRPTLRE